MNEAKNAVIDALEKEFGHDVLFSWSMDYDVTQDDCQKIFDILNKYFFNSCLKPIDIYLWPEDKVTDALNRDTIKTCAFIFVVARICHEMIHYYDRFTKEFHDKQLNHIITNKGFDSYKARHILYDVVSENDSNAKSDDIVRRFDGHTLFVRNKRTGIGFLAMFD